MLPMTKELIFIGLGRMGNAMTSRLIEQGYTVHGFDVDTAARSAAAENGVTTYETISQAITSMSGRKVVWVMVPSTFVDGVLADVYTELAAEDIVIDGGNTFFKDTKRRAAEALEKEINYVDCGTSGGVDGARHGASLMVGGLDSVVHDIDHIFIALAAPDGYAHIGASGSGHFVKMVHNGIEYGMMGAIAEGMNFIEQHGVEMELKPVKALTPYKNGSIISSSLINWLAEAYQTQGYLEQIAGEVPKGETEMEMEYIVSKKVSPVLEAALQQRKDTREHPSRTGTLISAMRNQFGGHKTITKK
jgi:6-phosphogluconate dehydrogenase